MKRSIINAVFALLVGVTLTFVGCEEPAPVVTPQFPEKVSAVVSAGDRYEFTISPNMAWSMKIPDEVATYFKFIVGETERYNLYGEAGTHTITVGVSNIEEFDTIRVCQISMTMGDQNQVVAEITRSGLERMAKMYLAEWDTENDVFTQAADESEEQYVYSTTPADRLDWVWSENNGKWLQRAIVEANFEWFISPSTPEWLNISVRVSDLDWRNINEMGDDVTLVGRTELFFQVNEEALPLEATSCNIELGLINLVNPDGEGVDGATFEAIASYPTEMEGCKSVCEVSFTSTLTFNSDGKYYQASSESYNDYAMGYIRSPRGAELKFLNKAADGSYSTEGANWVRITIDAFPEEAGEIGVWERSLTIRAAKNNNTEAREGALAAIPLSAVEAGNYNVEDYIVCAVYQQEYVEVVELPAIYPNNEEIMAACNSKFTTLAAGNWPYMGSWSSIPNAYKLIYQSNDSGDDLIFTIPFSRYEIYGFAGNGADAYDNATCWVTVEPSAEHKELENGYFIKSRLNETIDGYKYINTKAGSDGENEASILFYDENDKPYALIYLVLDPTYTTPIARPQGTVIFSNNLDYEALGATLQEIVVGDEEYDKEIAFRGTLQYRLTLNANCPSATLLVPEYWMSFAYAGWVTTADGDGRVTITVNTDSLPEVEEGTTEVSTNVSLFGSNDSTQVVQFAIVYQL